TLTISRNAAAETALSCAPTGSACARTAVRAARTIGKIARLIFVPPKVPTLSMSCSSVLVLPHSHKFPIQRPQPFGLSPPLSTSCCLIARGIGPPDDETPAAKPRRRPAGARRCLADRHVPAVFCQRDCRNRALEWGHDPRDPGPRRQGGNRRRRNRSPAPGS